MKHNNEIPNNHFRKNWQTRVKTWFNQPGRKKSRRNAREAKAKAIFPRPTSGSLRPIVHSQTIRYNMKTRLGRGFTLAELKEAGIPRKYAPTIGICVDHRRKNRCEESLMENAKRLKAYKAKLILFPRRSSKPKSGDSPAEELSVAAQLKGPIIPTTATVVADPPVVITDAMKNVKAYQQIRLERMNARQVGPRIVKAKEEEKKKEDAATMGKLK